MCIRDSVYIGQRPRSELYDILGSSAVTLMPVLWDEPFGLVALESLAAGTPVAGYRRGGLAEIVDASCGELVDPGDEAELARAIPRAVARAPYACRTHAERFSLAAMITGYEGVFAAVQGAASRGDRGYA